MKVSGFDCRYRLTMFIVTGVFAVSGPVMAQTMAYRFVDNMIALEAEELSYGAKWEKATARTGFSGNGYLIYKGPEMAPPAPNESNWENPPEQNDVDGRYQGSEADWLKIPVLIEEAGTYYLNIRNQHDHNCFEPWCLHDGDATVWTHVVGYQYPVRHNFAHSHQNNHAWMWMKFGPGLAGSDIHPTSPFQWRTPPGVVTFYVAGRDPNFKVDRIHIYKLLGRDPVTREFIYPDNHNNDNAPLSTLVDVGGLVNVNRLPPGVVQNAKSVFRDIRPEDMVRIMDMSGRIVFSGTWDAAQSLRRRGPVSAVHIITTSRLKESSIFVPVVW